MRLNKMVSIRNSDKKELLRLIAKQNIHQHFKTNEKQTITLKIVLFENLCNQAMIFVNILSIQSLFLSSVYFYFAVI